MLPHLTFLQKVDQIISNNLKNPKLPAMLSKELNRSPSQIYRKIRQQTGVSPSVYIRQKRLAQAHEWIKETEETLTLIAQAVGFQHLSYFSRCFRQEYGYTPSSLRKANKKK